MTEQEALLREHYERIQQRIETLLKRHGNELQETALNMLLGAKKGVEQELRALKGADSAA